MHRLQEAFELIKAKPGKINDEDYQVSSPWSDWSDIEAIVPRNIRAQVNPNQRKNQCEWRHES